MIVKKIISQILKELDISRYELAKRLGVSEQSLAHVVRRDAKAIRLSVLCKLREVYGVSWAQFGKLLDDEYNDD